MLWIEHYRPKKLSDVLLSDKNRKLFESFIEQQSIPHLMLVGGPGVGKTTVARILMQEIKAEKLELNASDERGIGVVREKIKPFLCTELLIGKKLKVVFLDEFDATTNEFQTSLRNLLETNTSVSRMICSLNYPSKIIEPIISRCQVVVFEPLGTSDVVKLLEKIAKAEKIEFSVDDLLMIAEDSKGDLRKAIGMLQQGSTNGKFTYSQNLIDSADLVGLMRLVKSGSWQKVYDVIQGMNNFEQLYTDLFNNFWLTNDKCVGIVGEFMYRDGQVFDRKLNFLCCLRELSKYTIQMNFDIDFSILKTSIGMSKRFEYFGRQFGRLFSKEDPKLAKNLEAIKKLYKVGSREALQYYKIICSIDKGELVRIRQKVGIE